MTFSPLWKTSGWFRMSLKVSPCSGTPLANTRQSLASNLSTGMSMMSEASSRSRPFILSAAILTAPPVSWVLLLAAVVVPQGVTDVSARVTLISSSLPPRASAAI